MDIHESDELRKIIREVVTEIIAPLPTRDEIKTLATRDEIKTLATRDEIKTLATRDEIKTLATRDEMQAAFDHQVMLIQQEFRQINQRLAALEARVAKLEENLGDLIERVNHRLEKTSDDIADLTVTTKKHRTDQLTMQERLDELESRVAQLEAARHG